MALYDVKIERFTRRAEQLDRNIKRDTEERKRLLSEIERLRYLSLCEKLNCEGENLTVLLAREHDQIQRLKERGYSDEDIDSLGNADSKKDTTTHEEEEHESNLF